MYKNVYPPTTSIVIRIIFIGCCSTIRSSTSAFIYEYDSYLSSFSSMAILLQKNSFNVSNLAAYSIAVLPVYFADENCSKLSVKFT